MMLVADSRSPVEIVGQFLTTAPVDLDGMAAGLGLRVFYDSNAPDSEAGRIQREGGRYAITVNGRDAPRRRRFTLAHEIAHYVLHRDLIGDGIVDSPLYRSGLPDTIESQANSYAASLLMPAALVRGHWRGGNRSVVQLADIFDVSYEAMKIRLQSLGYGA
jgi:Zn-dependent peptidase ImmA (M78 family)